jgi:2-octaprenyl-6-methoxyphenol hydroxylase
LRDAYLLAEKLSTLFSRTEDQKTPLAIETALQEYAQSRKADRSATIGLTDFMARIFTSKLAPLVIGRGLALSALQWLPPVKTALARQMMFGRR